MVEKLPTVEKEKKKIRRSKKEKDLPPPPPPTPSCESNSMLTTTIVTMAPQQPIMTTPSPEAMMTENEEAMAALLENILASPVPMEQIAVTEVIEEKKKYDINVCPFHACNLTVFESEKNKENYVKCAQSPCGIFTHINDIIPYMTNVYEKLDPIYITLKGNVKCQCNTQASLRVSQSQQNFNRPFYSCRDTKGCRFFQWADVPMTRRSEELQTRFQTK